MTGNYTRKVYLLALALLIAAATAAIGVWHQILPAAAANCSRAEATSPAPSDLQPAAIPRSEQPVIVLVAYHTL